MGKIGSKAILIFCLLAICEARVPPRNHETEESSIDNTPKENPIQIPVERSPIDSSSSINNENPSNTADKSNRKPIGVILFRTQPAFSLFRERSPFSPSFQPFDHSNHPHITLGSGSHDDPALRLLSLLFGNRRLRPMQPESTAETELVNESGESSEASEVPLERRHPFESIFPNIFVPRLDEFDKESESKPTDDDKTPDNFEKKENKVIMIGDKKFVKSTQVKKVKNDFGQFHSVISSYQPFDEKVHDENGNEKIKPTSELDDKSIEKKDVESSTSNNNEKVDSFKPEKEIEKVDQPSSTTSQPEKEESTKSPELITPKPNEKLIAENLSKDVSKNEIPDKNTEIKVDQMN